MSESHPDRLAVETHLGGTGQAEEQPRPAPRRHLAWSYSALKDYETCPHRVKLKLDGAPVPQEAENRGTTIHKLAERYVKGEIDTLPSELRKFTDAFTQDREAYQAGRMEVEQEWGFDNAWNPVGWFDPNIWLRIKCDQVAHLSERDLLITDHKTGKRFGNEVPHIQQAQLYALAGFVRYPNVQAIETEMRYLDHGEQTRKLWSRDKDYTRLQVQYMKRVAPMQIDRLYQAKPTRGNCRFCRYGISNGSGACGFAIPWEDK